MFRLVTYRDQDRVGPGLLLPGGEVVAIPGAPTGPGGLMAIVEEWEAWWPRLLAVAGAGGRPIVGAQLLAPLQYPGKMLFAGANYAQHAQEMAGASATTGRVPFFFLKPTRHCIVGPGEAVEIEAQWDGVDWEVEVAVVIGRKAKRVPVDRALDYVAGYVAVVDITERHQTARNDIVFRHDWVAGKGRDTFCPMGPALLPRAWAPPPDRIGLSLRVNGVEKQRGTTADLVHDIPHLVAYASQLMTLDPGDVIATGTPAGVGMGRGEFLRPGDELEAWVEGVGTLVNPVRLTD
ncbi:MAG: fumarylacetoacetate hydrolase family protein [Firmicutes bacterium]|nr:fumarylacetoacetate hydrolase family protein [Alicyclobacillaceae bacterium]MCL6496412.1 fumarylacetoacetate hydrolase family protein [Bacillota bacterium]